MKRILLTTVSLGVLGLMSPALGADLCLYAKAPSAAAPVYDWSGFYVGVFGGGGFGNHNYQQRARSCRLCELHRQLRLDGRHRRRRGRVQLAERQYVIGVEADGFWSGIKGSDASQLAPRRRSIRQSALGRHRFVRAAVSPLTDCCCSSTAVGRIGDIAAYQHRPAMFRRRSVPNSPERPHCRRRHRLCDHQQPDRQDRISLLRFRHVQPGRLADFHAEWCGSLHRHHPIRS